MTTENTKNAGSEKNSIFVESNMSYENKVKLLHNLRARIINNDPALQGLLTFVPNKVVPDGHTMFDSVAYTDGDEMFFADKFFALEKPFQCAAIIHEMFHIVFRHVTRGRKRIHSLFNIATDAIINESIGFEADLKIGGQNYAYFPKEHVISLDSIYTEFQIPLSDQKALHLWTSESLYDFLIKKLKDDLEKEEQEQMNSSNSQESEEQSNSNSSGNSKGKGKGKGKGKVEEKSKSDSSSQDKNAQGSNQAGKAQQSKASSSASDLEKIEKQIEEIQRRLAKKHSMFNGSDIIPDGSKEAGVSEIDDFKWTQRFNRAKSQSNNSKNSILGKINADVYKPKIPWYIELRKYLVKRCMPFTETTWVRPARRMSSIKSSKTYMPGIQNKKGLDKMVVIVDTSGSCFNEEELSMFCTEVQAIQSQTGVEIALIFADTDVQSEFIVKNDGISLLDKMKSGIVKAAGGGGTDMVKPFLYSLKKYRPVLTVICTDGFTPYPTKQEARKTNLLWVVNTNVEVPKECGKTLYIHPQ
jgi:predicted metal-dependent peptidase